MENLVEVFQGKFSYGFSKLRYFSQDIRSSITILAEADMIEMCSILEVIRESKTWAPTSLYIGPPYGRFLESIVNLNLHE